jgi:hypothetical protein
MAAAQAHGGGGMGGSGGLGRGTQQSLAGAAQSARTGTLVFGESPNAPAAMPPRPAPAAHGQQGHQGHVAPPPASPIATTHGSGGIGGAVNGHLAGKLGELGLSPAQADAVMALSREVVERVVWEVVPQLAETIIKEEIQRLMNE